jgi:hypothetical protein
VSTFLTVYHVVGQCVRPPLWLSSIQWVSASTFLTVCYSMGQCVHLYDCLPFNESLCPPLCCLPFNWSVFPPFLTVYHLLGQCVHLYYCLPFNGSVCPSVCLLPSLLHGWLECSPFSLCVERARGHYEAGQESRLSPSPSTRVYKESSQSGKVSCSPALHLFTWLKSSS